MLKFTVEYWRHGQLIGTQNFRTREQAMLNAKAWNLVPPLTGKYANTVALVVF